VVVWWCGGVVVWWCGGVVVWWCGGWGLEQLANPHLHQDVLPPAIGHHFPGGLLQRLQLWIAGEPLPVADLEAWRPGVRVGVKGGCAGGREGWV
jgi:hypothetical protein